jgi:hypothetical protein
VTSGYRGNFRGRICVETFRDRIYRALIHEEAASLSLAGNGEDGRNAVAEVHKVPMGRSLKSRSRIRVSACKSPAVMVTLWVSVKEAMAYHGWMAPYRLWQTYRELNLASLGP